MANNKIKGLTVEIGGDTTKLNKALANVEKKSIDLTGELKAINGLLKLDPSNVELLAQKQKVLADAVANTENKLDTLKEAERQVQAQFEKGEVSEEQVRALQREIIYTEKALESYNRAAKETADAMDQLAKDTGEASQEVDKLGDEAKDAEKNTEELGSSLDGLGTGLGVVTALVGTAIAGLAGLSEETREYRREIGKLETSFQDNEHSVEAAQKTYKALQGVLGETDQAVEAANHLAALTDTEEELAEWTDILTGVYGKFGASLPIEGLAEAANETSRTGTVTGGLADALNWAAEEGERFGLQLKEQIEFTELSKEELKKLTKEEQAAYEAQERRYKNIEEWNGAILEAKSAEDLFNIALSECTTEQERQQLITKTLTKMYKGAADQYKKTNKEIIRANEANEAWNATLAGVGAEMEPVLTDIKEMGTSLVKDLKKPLKSVVGWVRDKLLPALSNTGSWVKQNGPTIKATIAGVTAALVAYKVATIAAEVSQKGLKGAILATEAAQKLLNLTQAATPWGLIAVAIAGVTTALVALTAAKTDAVQPTEFLTEKELAVVAASEEAAAAFRDQQKATKDTLDGINSQMGYVTNLTDELFNLADATGKVKEEDEARVKFILGELKDATGEEYQLVDGSIQQYDKLKDSIKNVIEQKRANLLLEAVDADYTQAIMEESKAWDALTLVQKQRNEQLALTQQKEREYQNFKEDFERKKAEGYFNYWEAEEAYYANHLKELEDDWEAEKQYLAERQKEYDTAADNYNLYAERIASYEHAAQAAAEGNYEAVKQILAGKRSAYTDHTDTVESETDRAVLALQKEAEDAGRNAVLTKKYFEEGVAGYTEDMVKEAEQAYQDALDAYATAYADAESVGEDLSDGLVYGMEAKRPSLLQKAKSLVEDIIAAFRKTADCHSPARKTIDFGEDMGEGAEIGLENKTNDILKAAKHQVQAMLEVYNGNDNSAAIQQSVTAMSSRQQAQDAQAAASSAAQLGKILAAIERGQILTIDGNALVGATAGKMDSTLGQRRALAARGAL